MTLKEFRKSRGMTLAMLAEHLDCSPSALCKYETNVETVPDHIIQKVKTLFDVDIKKEYNTLAIYKKRIKDLEDSNNKLVEYGIKTEQTLVALQEELNALLIVVNQQMNKINKILKGR